MSKYFILSLLLSVNSAMALTVQMFETAGSKQNIGTIAFQNSTKGLEIIPNLHSLSPGPHGFHIHLEPNCGNQGANALGHFDPHQSEEHLGPYLEGHLGDLPKLVVNTKGLATKRSYAPRLTLADLKGHSVMIHEGGDNYKDKPKPLGGGGARIACGVI